MKLVKITCDNCDKDLTDTGNCVDYRIALVVERIPSRGGEVTLMDIPRPLERDYHFCGEGCLRKYMANEEQL